MDDDGDSFIVMWCVRFWTEFESESFMFEFECGLSSGVGGEQHVGDTEEYGRSASFLLVLPL